VTHEHRHDRRLDFSSLKTRVSIAQVLAAYGADRELARRGRQLVGPCPVHGGDNPTAFRVHLDRGIWRCFTACGGGDVVDLVRALERCSFAQAAKSLASLANHPPLPPNPQPPSDEPSFRPFTFRIPLGPHAALLQRKRIAVETAQLFEAGVTHRSKLLRGTIAVRLHDLAGHPLGYCGRRLDNEQIRRWGKWRFPRNFPKGRLLYNAHRALLHRAGGLVVCECPWSIMRLHQAGIPGAVALLGTTLTPIQAEFLARAPHVLFLFDGDPPGRNASRNAANLLDGSATVHIHDIADGLDPDDLSDTELQRIVAQHLPAAVTRPPLSPSP